MPYKKSRCAKGSRRIKGRSKCVKTSKVSKSKTSKSKASKGCSRKYTKKYSTRSSPSYPANECCGSIKKGNDGKRYVSKPMSKGICRWIKM